MTLHVKASFENGYASGESPEEFVKRIFKRLEPDLELVNLSVKQT